MKNKKSLYKEEFNPKQSSLISFKKVTKSYKTKIVLKDVNFNLKEGDNIAIIGHNGSGKSTFLDILSRINKPTSGTIQYKTKDENTLGRLISVQNQIPIFPEGYKVYELLNYFWKLIDKEERLTKDEFNQIIYDIFQFKPIMKKRLESLSGGEKQRVNILASLLRKPKVLILDELASGLDVDIYNKVLNFIKEYTKSKKISLILVTHKFSEIKELTNKVYLVGNQNIKFVGNSDKFSKNDFRILTYEHLLSSKKIISEHKRTYFEQPRLAKFSNWLDKKYISKWSKKEQTADSIKISAVDKFFGNYQALSNINFEIKKGERIALLGRNGSGKTTLAEIIATTQNPTRGTVSYWWGKTNYRITAYIGMQFQQNLFPNDLTVKEVLWFFARSSHNTWDSYTLLQAIETFRLTKLFHQRAGTLSGGERQRLNILIALLKKPEVLILDEISTGLDVQSIKQINIFLLDFFKKHNLTLILISHNASEIYELATKAIVLEKGKVKGPKYDLVNMNKAETRSFLNKIIKKKAKKGDDN